MRILPEEYHAQFLGDYEDAVRSARRPEQFRTLQEILRLWRLRAVAYSTLRWAVRVVRAWRPGIGLRVMFQDYPGGPYPEETRQGR